MEKKKYEHPSTEVVELKSNPLLEVISPAEEPDTPVGSRQRNSSWDHED